MQIRVQSRSDKVDLFAHIIDSDNNLAKNPRTLVAAPLLFIDGDISTDPEHALMTLSVREARDLANRILRVVGKEGS